MFWLLALTLCLCLGQIVFVIGNEAAEKDQCVANDGDLSCTSENMPPILTTFGSFELLDTVPHDPRSFTQGLELYNDTHMLESAGSYMESNVRLVEIADGQVVRRTKLEDRFFAEGLTRCRGMDKDELVLLTWREQTGFVVNPETLEIQSQFHYTTTNNEGWGVACDANSDVIYVTDGTAFLHAWNASTREQISKVQVQYQFTTEQKPRPLSHINELELDDRGFLLANVWYRDVIVRIHPSTGFIHKVYDLSTLRPRDKRGSNEDCLNGIAHVSSNIFWVTGKLWPVMYKIRLREESFPLRDTDP